MAQAAEADRQRDQRGAVRRAGRHRRAAVQPGPVRGDDRARRRRREAEPEGVRAAFARAAGERLRDAAPRATAGARARATLDGDVARRRPRRHDRCAGSAPAVRLRARARRRATRGCARWSSACRHATSPPLPPHDRCCSKACAASIDYQDPAYAGAVPRPPGARSRECPATSATLLARDRAPPGAVDVLRGHDPRRRAEDARHPLRARARRGARQAATRCWRSTSTCTRGCRRSARRCPAGLGRWLTAPAWPRRLVERFTRKGRVVTTSSLRGFLMLYAVAGMKRWRRSTTALRDENRRIEQWLARIAETAARQSRAGGRGGAVPAPGQGLQRHPRARLCATTRR